MASGGKSEARAKVMWEGGLRTNTLIRGMELGCDKPKGLFGTNTAPAPMEIFSSAMGSCLMTTFLYSAHKSRMHVSDISVDVRTESDFVDGLERIVAGSMKLSVWTEGAEQAKIEKIFELARTHCTVTNAINFPLEFELKIKD
ncbi:MAG: OsmC family protein [Thermoplasmata archaeon]|nr:OsmC family protein [Thermoplasmata archaeon]